MSDLQKKLAERLEAACNAHLYSNDTRSERWQIVADTIQLMIQKAAIERSNHEVS